VGLLVSMREIAGHGTDDGQYRGSNARDLALSIPAATVSVPPAFPSWPRRLVGLRRIEGRFDRIVNALKPDEAYAVACLFRYVLDVLAVAGRKHDGQNASLEWP
jgi:hypothetical protein